jgi:hypothetical protein
MHGAGVEAARRIVGVCLHCRQGRRPILKRGMIGEAAQEACEWRLVAGPLGIAFDEGRR